MNVVERGSMREKRGCLCSVSSAKSDIAQQKRHKRLRHLHDTRYTLAHWGTGRGMNGKGQSSQGHQHNDKMG